MSDLEELVLVQYILDLGTKEFPLQKSIVEDIANRILATCSQLRVGKN
jgi:hypothetical protein